MAKKRIKYTKDEIRDFAKDMFLEIGKNKRQKYSLQQICNEIELKCNKKLTKATISRWSDKYGWKNLFIKNIQYNIRKAEEEAEVEERDILLKKGKSLKDLYKNTLLLSKASSFQLAIKLKNKELGSKELLELYKKSSELLMKLNDIDTENKDEETNKLEIEIIRTDK